MLWLLLALVVAAVVVLKIRANTVVIRMDASEKPSDAPSEEAKRLAPLDPRD